MYGGRFTTGPPSAARKSKIDGKPSMLPKPRRPASTDRSSMDAHRPSNSYRSSSAEPSRNTLAVSRLSREASASKLPLNRRSRSQQQDRYGQASMTPLRNNPYSRTTTTPVRTPSEDRQNRSWQASLDRALSFVTVKDVRPISNTAWQRAEFARVLEGLSARGAGGGQAPLTRPLTITRFVEVCGELLSSRCLAGVTKDAKLNNDNYLAKLPNLAKRLLYPGAVSKSWLRTVNTLHAFPHALAFIAYFLDLVTHIETPITEEFYAAKDELAALRRDFLEKSWDRFQTPGASFDDLEEEYLSCVRRAIGHDEERLQQLQDTIQKCQATLEDESELAARAEEERVKSRRDTLFGRLRAVRTETRNTRAQIEEQRAKHDQRNNDILALDQENNSITAEIQQLKRDLESQDLSVAERAKLLDEVDYATRVIDSKRTLAEQVSKILLGKETELGLWQKLTLDSCVQYKQALINLASRFPQLAALAVDEQELMLSSCASAVSLSVETLRLLLADITSQRAHLTRQRQQLTRQRDAQLEEARAQISELKASIDREINALSTDTAKENAEAAAFEKTKEELQATLEKLLAGDEEYKKVQKELEYWETQNAAWTTQLSNVREYINSLGAKLRSSLDAAKRERADQVLETIRTWNQALDRLEAEEAEEAKKSPPAHPVKTELVL